MAQKKTLDLAADYIRQARRHLAQGNTEEADIHLMATLTILHREHTTRTDAARALDAATRTKTTAQ